MRWAIAAMALLGLITGMVFADDSADKTQLLKDELLVRKGMLLQQMDRLQSELIVVQQQAIEVDAKLNQIKRRTEKEKQNGK